MKVERTQLPLASASKQISQFAASRRVDPAPDYTQEEANKRKKQRADQERDDDPSPSLAHGPKDDVRLLNITA